MCRAAELQSKRAKFICKFILYKSIITKVFIIGKLYIMIYIILDTKNLNITQISIIIIFFFNYTLYYNYVLI